MTPFDPSLPAPGADAAAHSARVVARVRDEIDRAGGFIPLARYIELVLYAPGLGYYVAGARRFGPAGDFVTAPEMTPLYSAAIARQLERVLAAAGDDDVVELGAGSGALAAGVLNAFADDGRRDVRYRILEVSAPLRHTQRETLAREAPALANRVEWIDGVPQRIRGAIVMNEVLDAIPPHVVVRRAGEWHERGVVWRNGSFALDERPLDDSRLRTLAQARFPASIDYASEISPAAEALVTTLAQRVEAGALLIVDYGFPRREYYHPDRREGTLVGHYRHRVHTDPFLWPGLSDLTAHVDFTAVAEAGQRGGARVAGYATQASFLMGCGFLELLAGAAAPDSVDYMREAGAVQRLLSPAEMGELFKVLLLARGVECPFLAISDMSRRL
jgi:SAM-dependent MidA family methyltransferase